MKTIKAFIKSHPLLSYFALAFTLSWGAVLIVVGPSGFLGTKEIPEVLEPFLYVTMVLGPSVAGILLTSLLYGRAGLREFGSRLLRCRVGARWYALALLLAPLSMIAVLFALSLTSPVYIPGIFITDDKTTVLLSGIAGGLVAGIFEELGWTGFAIPTLLGLRYSVLSTGLIVGVLWGAWHLLGNDIWASVATAGDLSLALFVVLRGLSLLVGQLLAFRVLMVWVYERTNGSLLLAILMHASFAACTFILNPVVGPGAMSGSSLLTYDLVLAAALWIVVGVVAVATRGHLSRQPLRGQVT